MIRQSVPACSKLPYSIKYAKDVLKNYKNKKVVHIPSVNFILNKRSFEENAKIISDYYYKNKKKN